MPKMKPEKKGDVKILNDAPKIKRNQKLFKW